VSRLSNKQPQNYRPVSVKKVKAQGASPTEGLGEEPEEQKTFPSFLKNLPGVTSSDSKGYRIEALRVYIENQLGDQAFLHIYRTLVVRLLFISEHGP